jgi:hypothetical protein
VSYPLQVHFEATINYYAKSFTAANAAAAATLFKNQISLAIQVSGRRRDVPSMPRVEDGAGICP